MKVCPKCSICYDDNQTICPTDREYLETSWPASRLIAGKYLLKSMLAKGGMGVIYRAIQSELNREVAIKILSPQFLSKERLIKQFHREALAVARLDHKNIIPIYDYGSLPGNNGAYLVMRLVTGKLLSDEIDELGHFPLERALRIMQQICSGISAAHSQKIIHCDLKPDNILIENCRTLKEQVQIVDFGIAKLKELSLDGTSGSAITDSAIGTPQYMSPEQCCGESLTIHTDIYSLGIIFFEMITGRLPFNGTNPVYIAEHQVRTPPPPPSRFKAGISTALDYAILHALAKRPTGRPQSAQAFFEELAQASGIVIKQPTVELSEVPPAVLNNSVTASASSSSFSSQQLNPYSSSPSFIPSKILEEPLEKNSRDKTTKTTNKGITSQLTENKTNPFLDFKSELSKSSPGEQLFPDLMVLMADNDTESPNIEDILEDFGCTIFSTATTDEAWEYLQKYSFNLVICEALSPEVNGWQLFARAQDLPNIPLFIFISSTPKNEDRILALEQGVEDYWAKPLPMAELQIRLRRLLKQIAKDMQ
jgi:serine/threonine protein kinase